MLHTFVQPLFFYFKFFFKLSMNIRTNSVTFSKRLQFLNISMFINCKSILFLHLAEHNSLNNSSSLASRWNWNDPSAWSTKQLFLSTLYNWNLIHKNSGRQNQKSDLIDSEVKCPLDKLSCISWRKFDRL